MLNLIGATEVGSDDRSDNNDNEVNVNKMLSKGLNRRIPAHNCWTNWEWVPNECVECSVFSVKDGDSSGLYNFASQIKGSLYRVRLEWTQRCLLSQLCSGALKWIRSLVRLLCMWLVTKHRRGFTIGWPNNNEDWATTRCGNNKEKG